MPELFRGKGTAARRVYADNHGLHVFVVGQLLQVFVHLVGHNLMASTREQPRGGRVHDVAIGVIDGHLLAVFLLLHVFHCSNAHLVDFLVFVDAQQLLHLGLHLVVIAQSVNEFHLLHSLGTLEHHQAVGIGIERIGVDFSAVGDGLNDVVPNARDEGIDLLAVGLAHAVFGVHFRGTLVFSYLHHLHFDAHFLEQVFHEHRFRGNAVPVDFAAGVQIDFVGHGAEVVGTL